MYYEMNQRQPDNVELAVRMGHTCSGHMVCACVSHALGEAPRPCHAVHSQRPCGTSLACLQPWVERIWRRRRQRARAGAASHSTDAGTGLMSSGGETALSSLSESEGSSGEGGEAAAGMDSSLSEE